MIRTICFLNVFLLSASLTQCFTPLILRQTYGFLSVLQESWETATNDDESNIALDPFVPDSPDDLDMTSSIDEHSRWCKSVDKATLNLQSKQRSLENELEKVGRIDEIKARADLLKAYLYMFKDDVTTATVFDWETNAEKSLTLDDTYESASDEVEGLYKQIRKYQRGSDKIEEQLQNVRKNLQELKRLQTSLESCRVDDSVDAELFNLVQEKLFQSSKSTRFTPPKSHKQQEGVISSNETNKLSSRTKPALGTPASNVRKIESPSGCIILVGRNKRGNEYLSCSYAKPNDIWMHARGSPGAHVLLLQRRGSPLPQDEDMQLALDLAAFYSDARTEQKVPVTITSPKHIVKPKRAPLGAVHLRQELKTSIGNPQNVPDDLKEQRAASGRSDEYRQQDKGKLRKQNKKQSER